MIIFGLLQLKYIKSEEINIKESHFFSNLFQHIKSITEELNINKDKDILNIAFIHSAFPSDEILPSEQKEIIWKYYRKYKDKNNLKGKLFLTNYNNVDLINNEIVINGAQIHCIIELDVVAPMKILLLAKEKKVAIINGMITILMANKFNLSLLSEYQDSPIFSENERCLIKKHIPWSRKLLNIETTYKGEKGLLIDFVLRYQERFVLKKALGSQGADVFIGYKTQTAKWKEIVEKAVSEKKWLVQKFVKSQEYWYQYETSEVMLYESIFGLYVFGELYAGGFVRILPIGDKDGIINSKRGAGESTILVVD